MLAGKQKSSYSVGMRQLPTQKRAKILKSLRMTPAMAAGVSDTLHDMEWIVGLIDARAPAPKKRGPYKKRV